jgi:hypothetical protein
LIKPSILLLALALAPAAIASPYPDTRSKAAEPSAIPVPLRQALTLDQRHTPASLAQAEPQSDPTMPAASSGGPSEAEKTAELAREAQNPIANLISLPFQNNTTFRVGPQEERTLNVLNIQPVIPVPLSKDLLLVSRTIAPVINQPTSPTGRESLFGLGDINPQLYFVPRTNSKIT